MNFLFIDPDENNNNLAIKIFNRHFELDPGLHAEYSDQRKRMMFNDIVYNLEYLGLSVKLGDDKIFPEYTIWVYRLLCNLMKDIDSQRIKDQIILHYKIMEDFLIETLSKEDGEKYSEQINRAIAATERDASGLSQSPPIESGKHREIRKEYLTLLLENNTHKAIELVLQAENSGILLEDVFVEILQEVMIEVGDLWHQNKITVDKEHYSTATTQLALAQFYPKIFSRPKNGCKILACCVGSELHEMGVRMISDLFEYNGWDSIYLGAGVPQNAILKAIRENKPDLVALSVTMPHHLPLCLEIIKAIREEYKDIKIAVGGRAFQVSDQIWKKWQVDFSAKNAREFVEWANNNLVKKAE
jgi:methanogenic corrinoid protein MtbC1